MAMSTTVMKRPSAEIGRARSGRPRQREAPVWRALYGGRAKSSTMLEAEPRGQRHRLATLGQGQAGAGDAAADPGEGKADLLAEREHCRRGAGGAREQQLVIVAGGGRLE